LLAGLFDGFKGAVIAIVLQALVRIGRRSLTTRFLVGLAIAAFVAMFVCNVPFPFVVLAAAAAGLVLSGNGSRANGLADSSSGQSGEHEGVLPNDARGRPATWRYSLSLLCVFGLLWLGPVAALYMVAGVDNVFSNLGSFFSKLAVVTFGGAYAVLSYVAQEAVEVHDWLSPGEMIDGLALAETTPGPLILVVQFVGFVAAFRNPGMLPPWVAGLFGSLLTLWVTFVPCFLWIFLGAPHIERLRDNRWLRGALSAVTAAVVGVIANLAVWFTLHAMFAEVKSVSISGLGIEWPVWATIHWGTMWITFVALLMIFRLNASVVVTLAVTGLMGMAGKLLGG
jgi:chromate transporter